MKIFPSFIFTSLHFLPKQEQLHKLGHPLFLLSITILAINDWVLKTTFHNALTGKLSDFAGLFALPYFLSTFFPKRKLLIHLIIGLMFILWKSECIQAVIDLVNTWGIALGRTVDPSDNIALVSTIISYGLFERIRAYPLRLILYKTIAVFSVLSFLATSFPKQTLQKFVSIDKTYRFNFSRRELISRLNMVQIKNIYVLNQYSGEADFDASKNIFHWHGQKDTLAMILDDEKFSAGDTITYKTSYAQIQIIGNDSTSTLKLINLYKFVPAFSDKDYREKAIKQFEKWTVKKIRKYRREYPVK
ncbi:hypothetical protein [Haliscomenobacter hydrossis]|uniref:Uncharacterized protein n=1 Tax=Haliscomenobacter hydrossis (strain ATCC 27775 / DSM 1100 / LMG 10767 / O) TaxID=760192 RepID=F4L797_HALH1|nr:hypothetical protein [Haliscomenobacter hydrossis]AEE53124.1 hypothetical protein Halhy_5299 [Haliscomenobacter hydrossis DSM 1100]